MIIVDRAISARLQTGRPIVVGMYGIGFMGRGMLINVERYTKVLHIAAICNRNIERAISAFAAAGIDRDDIQVVTTASEMSRALDLGKRVVTDDPSLIARSAQIEVVLETTGHVEYGAKVTLECIANGKDIVSLNVELDATVGQLLRVKAEQANVIFSGADGDQPGVTMNLVRHIEAMGLRPLVCGNIKGLQDRYRNPTTQESFARQWNQTPSMVASFADGTKMTAEQAIVANAVGLKVSQRGMVGREHNGHVDDLVDFYDIDQLRELGGIVDYVVGTRPSPGVYVLAEAQDENQTFFLNLGKLGKGPLYSFYTAWHLTTLEFGISIARVALCRDVVIGTTKAPSVDVIAAAKRSLKKGEIIDGIGGYMTYGVGENYDISRQQNLLPMGLAENCRLKRDIAIDEALTYDDVEPPAGSVVHALRHEQDLLFPVAPRPTVSPAASKANEQNPGLAFQTFV
ncbi:NAD(P)H-dependent oxidoreductase [Phyllobacterium zundukense]|uniref:NAD(P)-dependent oxidoreductase n=1 Tax=Phyllobacterium zundukense TaxID=1867719 RepID=A0A2N9VQT8_9HYPH|nr:SAF domain-containing protein [Phyllobacterium zundukense]ATU92291.1 NAD(P)-dependent oxidoreductase [Phyllobacterium zundukense]PIO41856.1 NAD(P)-dependent oxidoreductase [Phyllobacterium zundukense]